MLTGAGVSRESGVLTFRDEDGHWKQFRPEDIATPEAFFRDPAFVWGWYDARRQSIAKCRPNAAHETIAAMERTFRPGEFLLVTQNVDGLHEQAGSAEILRLHGSIWEVRCTRCDHQTEDRTVPLPQLPPPCPNCGAPLRPGVVWFGEGLDEEDLEQAFSAAQQARTVLVVGTSSLVYPAASLPEIALAAGARVIEVNPERTPLSPFVAERLAGPAAELLPSWWAERSASWTAERTPDTSP